MNARKLAGNVKLRVFMEFAGGKKCVDTLKYGCKNAEEKEYLLGANFCCKIAEKREQLVRDEIRIYINCIA